MLQNYQLGKKILLAQYNSHINGKKITYGANILKRKSQHCCNLPFGVDDIINKW